MQFTFVMFLYYSINTQSFAHDKSSSVSQFISGKSRNLQKLLRYLGEIVTSTFKIGTAGLICISFISKPCYFVLYSNDLPSEALSLILTISSL